MYYILGDYFNQEINDWVVDELWDVDGEHLIEPSDYDLEIYNEKCVEMHFDPYKKTSSPNP